MFVLAKTVRGQLYTIPWKATGTVGFWATQPVDISSSLGFWIRQVPGHALHEKGLQRQIGVGTVVSSQERRALLVPRLNRWSTVCFVPPPVYIGFPLFVLAKRRSEQLFTVPWRARGTVGFRADRNVGTLFCSASCRPAVRRAACRTDPPLVCPGFGLDRSL